MSLSAPASAALRLRRCRPDHHQLICRVNVPEIAARGTGHQAPTAAATAAYDFITHVGRARPAPAATVVAGNG